MVNLHMIPNFRNLNMAFVSLVSKYNLYDRRAQTILQFSFSLRLAEHSILFLKSK